MDLPIYICPTCASFELQNNRGFECINCGSVHKTRHLKLTHDYAAHVYLYGHLYREDYQKQVDKHGEVEIYYCIEPESIYKFIGLAMLSGVIGNLAWDLIKTATFKIISEYNKAFEKNHEISEEELNKIYRSFDIFLKHSGEIDNEVMAGIIQEILAHESGKAGKKLVMSNIRSMINDNPREKEKLIQENIKLLRKMSKTIQKKIRKKQEAEDEDFSNYWSNIKIE